MQSVGPQAAVPVQVGEVLGGKYEVRRVIGQGGMGVVVEANHRELNQRVALKFLLRQYALQKESAGRFLREARAAVRIKSEHVARVSDVGRLEHDEPFMVMEFLEGHDLAKELNVQGRLGVSEAVDYIIQACEAVGEAHSIGIIHRDLKPGNFFLTRRPDGTPLVKVLDFGISKVSEADELTKTSVAMGSALYMSPEQMESTRDVDARTDVYALGISLYELLAGRPPFIAESLPQLCTTVLKGRFDPLRSLQPEVPEKLERVVHKAFALDRDKRYRSVADLVKALAPFAPPRSAEDIGRVLRLAATSSPDEAAGAAAAKTADPLPTNVHADTVPIAPADKPRQIKTEPMHVKVGEATGSPAVSASVPEPRPSTRARVAVVGLMALAAVATIAALAFGIRGGGSRVPPAAPPEAAARGPASPTAEPHPTSAITVEPLGPAIPSASGATSAGIATSSAAIPIPSNATPPKSPPPPAAKNPVAPPPAAPAPPPASIWERN